MEDRKEGSCPQVRFNIPCQHKWIPIRQRFWPRQQFTIAVHVQCCGEDSLWPREIQIHQLTCGDAPGPGSASGEHGWRWRVHPICPRAGTWLHNAQQTYSSDEVNGKIWRVTGKLHAMLHLKHYRSLLGPISLSLNVKLNISFVTLVLSSSGKRMLLLVQILFIPILLFYHGALEENFFNRESRRNQ